MDMGFSISQDDFVHAFFKAAPLGYAKKYPPTQKIRVGKVSNYYYMKKIWGHSEK